MGSRGPKPSSMNVACPNETCTDYSKTCNGNIVVNGTYQALDRRVHKYICRTCSKSLSSASKTIFYDLKTDEGKFLRV